MAAPDYGNDYATVLPNGRLVLDLSAVRLTGPMVPVVRTARAWLEVIGDAIESTPTLTQVNALASRLTSIASSVEHVLRAEGVTVSLGADKSLRVSGLLHVGGAGSYPLNVTANQLGDVLARVQ
jgi:hypothetical protein